MSGRSWRTRANLESLAKKHVHKCQHPGCPEEGYGCYDSALALRPARWFCGEHLGEHGYCYDCQLLGTGDRFARGPGKGFCDGCWESMVPYEAEIVIEGERETPADESHGLPPPAKPNRFEVLDL